MEQAPVSRRAQKRLAREERTKELRKQKKLMKKEEKKQAKADLGDVEHQEPKWDALPFEPPNPSRLEKKQMLQESTAKAQARVTIAIDCAFEKYMTDGEKKTAAIPCKLVVCGLEPFLKTRLDKMKADTAWPTWGTSITTEPVEKAFDLKQLIYLSADSDTLLENFDENKVYVIGGIVDRNRYKGLCANKARSLGIATARFPLDVYFAKVGFSRVLTTNHCVDVLLEFLACQDWMQACKRGVPVRKLSSKRLKSHSDHSGDDEQEEKDVGEEEEEEEKGATPDGKVSPVRSHFHAIVIGATSAIGRTAVHSLFASGWSVLALCSNVEEGKTMLKDVQRTDTSGEIVIAPGDGSNTGDIGRLKEIVFHRFERTAHAIVFADVPPQLPSRAIFVREFFRIWMGPDRVVPKFLFVKSEDANIQGWTRAFTERLPEDHVELISPDDKASLDTSLEWVKVVHKEEPTGLLDGEDDDE